MEKKITFLFMFVLVVFSTSARLVEVSGPDVFNSLYTAAQDGDTLMVQSGTYGDGIALAGGKSVTIMAPDTAEAIFTNSITGDGAVDVEGASLSFEGIIVDNTKGYYVNYSSPGNVALLSWENCEIKNINRCFFYGGHADSVLETSSVEELLIKNCVIHDCNEGNWNMMWVKVPILNITIDECTFYNNDGVESFYLPRNTYEHISHTFTFTHNTVFQGSRDDGRYICNVGDSFTGEESSFDFENNIIVCPDGGTAGGMLKAAMGVVTMKNNLIVGYKKYDVTTIYDSTIESNYTLADFDMTSTGQLFVDPSNGDFSIYTVSPLATAGSDGGVIGASKWLIDAGTLYTLNTGLYEGVDSLAGKISGPSEQIKEDQNISLSAVSNYGFRFVKWVDASGNTLSEENPYSFTMDGDKSVFAVFKAIKLYKLDLTIEGNGVVDISKAGKDGEYEYYEEGTEITLTAKTNPVLDFLFWNMTESSNTYRVMFDSDKSITATFAAKHYICGWDFNPDKDVTQNRDADWVGQLVDTTDIPVLSMYYSYSPDAPFSGWWNRYNDGYNSATFWKYYTEDGKSGGDRMTGYNYYYQTRISTEKYKDIVVKYSIKSSYYGYDTWKLMYSYNNMSWLTADTAAIKSSWQDFCDTIPNTSGRDVLYVRLTPDITSTTHGKIADVDGTYIANVFILADFLQSSVDNVKNSSIDVTVKNGLLEVSGVDEMNIAYLIGLDGSVIHKETVSSDFSWDVSGLKGVYILKIGKDTKKLIFR